MVRSIKRMSKLLMLLACTTPVSMHADTSTPDRFARLTSAPDPIYAGQAFFITLSIYSTGMPLDKSVSISGLPADTNLTLETFQELAAEQEQLGDKLFDVRRFRCRAMCHAGGSYPLTPTLQGTLIEELRSFFFVQRHLRPVMIPVTPFTLRILPLPADNRPDGFTGAVGLFRFQASAAPLNIAPGDIVTVQIQIDGVGLPPGIMPPAVQPVSGLKVYDSRPLTGQCTDETRVFTQTVVPVDPALTHIPAICFTSFNPVAGRYETATAGPFPIVFHAEPATVAPVFSPRTNKNTVSHMTGSHASEQIPRNGFIGSRLLMKQAATVELLHVPGTTHAHLAPSRTSLVLFTLQKDSLVRIMDRQEGWLRVEAPDGIGWIPVVAP